MFKGILGIIVILFLIFVFLVWSFELTSPDQTENNLIRMIKEAVVEVGQSFKELKNEIKIFKNKKLTVPLNKTEINVLKEKILDYEKEKEN